MTSNEGTDKITPRPEGLLGDKDSGGNIPPANMEPIHNLVADLSGTGAKYQEDQTQSSRLRYQSLTKNKGEPSYEGELDTQPMLLTYADVRAILISKDEAQESDKGLLAAGDDMDEDPRDDKEVRTPLPKQAQPEPSHVQESASDLSSPDLKKFDNILPLTERQLIRYLRKMSKVLFNRITKKQWEQHEEAKVSYADLKAFGFDFSTLMSTMKSIQDHVVKQQEASAAWMKTSTNMAWNLGSRMSGVELSQTALKREISSLRKDTSKIKSMMIEMYAAFQGHSSSAPSGKGIATESGDDPSKKLIKASFIVRPDLDEPVRDKEEQIKKAKEEARLNAISKPEVIKVVREEAKKLGIHPKEAITTKAGKLFKKAQDVEHKVLKRQHIEKVRKSLELRKHKYDSYMWTVSIVKDLMKSLSQRYERLKKVPGELGIQSALLAPEQTPLQVSGRKQKHMELKPKIRIPGLECNRALP
ncbi:hypothetical protein Tco_1301126 [Tanacetum coccineum]